MPSTEMIPIEEVAKRLGRSIETVKAGLKQGTYPFGLAVVTEQGQHTYQIPRLAFENWMKFGNQQILQQVVIGREDFDTLAKVIIAR